MHALLACAALAAAALGVAAQQDVCNGAGGRPVLAVPGFTSSPLYDSANGYRRVFPLLVGENQDNDTLALPLEFEGLSQANDSLTPASGPNDDMPTLSGEAGLFLEELIWGDLKNLINTWTHPTNESIPMWYTLAWDWRRDLYEQSQFVATRVRALRAATGCRPIVAGHSYGGRLIYTAVARFADLSDEIAGMMYFTAPLVGTTALTPSAPSNFDNGDFAAKERQLSYGSAFAAAPSAPIPICNNAIELGGSQTRECGAAEQEIGVACGGAACGRPADWPENQPFFMPVNFTSAEQWRNLGMGLSQYRRAAGQAPMLTDNEFNFLQTALQLTARMNRLVAGDGVQALQRRHPPSTLVSIGLTNAPPDLAFFVDLPPSTVPRWIECTPNGRFGTGAAPWCSGFALKGMVPGDGLVPVMNQELLGQGWGNAVKTFRMTSFPDRWGQLTILGSSTLASDPEFLLTFSAHRISAQLRTSEEDTPLVCSDVSAPGSDFPSLEQLVCDVVERVDALAGAGAPPPPGGSTPVAAGAGPGGNGAAGAAAGVAAAAAAAAAAALLAL